MRVKMTLVVALGLLALMLGGLRPSCADDAQPGTDANSAAGILLWDLLQNDAKHDPNHTLFLYDTYAVQTAALTGTANRVAQYDPLDSGLKIQGLLYQKELSKDLITVQMVYAGQDAYRLEAGIDRPNVFKVRVRQTSVFHRLEQDTNDINIDFNPTATYNTTWQRTQIDADKSLTRNGEIGAYGGYSYQSRSGVEQHSFFELHRFNCTDCHTIGFMQAIGEHTEDLYAGLRAHFPRQQLVVDGNVATSNYVSSASVNTYNFGPPFGISALYPNPNSHDDKQELQAYLGEGNWRLGFHLEDLNRTNQSTGQTLKSSHLSVQGTTAVSTNLTLSGGAYSQQDNNSVLTNLSNNQQRLWLQAAWRARKNLHLTARVGQQDKSYSILGQVIPNAHDQYLEVRADYRPGKRLYLSGKFRNDNIDHPYFATDFASRSEVTAEAVYTAPKFVAGSRYDTWYGSNTSNATSYTDLLFYLSAPINQGKIVLNATYDVSNVSDTNAFGYFFSAPVYPALGSNFAVFDQLGFPYAGQTTTLMFSASVPIGKKKPWRLTPSYRQINTNTFGSYLINLPGVAQNAALNIQQNMFGLKLDIPLKKTTDRLGFGWETDTWSDVIRPFNSGTFNIFNVYLTRRY